MKRKLSVKVMAIVAILSALSAILIVLNFPLSFLAPSFYKLDFADVPALIGGFAFGPFAGLLIQFLKILIKFFIEGTQTAFVGEISNFIIGVSFVVPASIIYCKNKTKNNALKALIISSVISVVVAALANYYFIIPAYVEVAKFPLEAIIGSAAKIYPIIDSKFKLILLCTIPFNIFKVLASDIITWILYKRISPFLHSKN